MNIKLNQHITIEQRQELVLTPDLIQSVKILKYNLMELDSYVKEQVKDNPVLEQKEPVWEEQLKNYSRDNHGTGKYHSRDQDDEYYSFENYISQKESLEEYLMMQLEVNVKSEAILEIGEYLIESLDENGYLNVTLKSVADDLNVDKEQVKKALGIIQSFEPYGVGARNLAECLSIQLRQVGMLDHDYIELLKYHMGDFSANRLMKISRTMKIPVEKVQQMADVLRHLDPKPGKAYSKENDQQYIIPEIIVEEEEGKFKAVFQQDYAPQLMISSYYESVLNEYREDPEVLKYIKSRLESANRLIKSIEKRKQTIINVAQTIIDYQQDFFRKGNKALKPLTLKMIAERIGMHESTVSRAVNGKYLQCRNGVFELKFFMSSGLRNNGSDGKISSNGIKAYIKEMIGQEDPKHPLSDQKVTDMLNEKGFGIARRTVAKYRENMNIPAAAMRKRY